MTQVPNTHQQKIQGEYQRAGPDTGMAFSHQPSEWGAGAPLACPDTDLVSLSVFQETQRPSRNNSTEERTRNTLIVSYCKKSLLFSVLSWEAWKTAGLAAHNSHRESNMSVPDAFKISAHHKHQRFLSAGLIKHFSTISPDSFRSCQQIALIPRLHSQKICFFTISFTDYRWAGHFCLLLCVLPPLHLSFSFKKIQHTHLAINKLYGQDIEAVIIVPQSARHPFAR